MEKENWKYWLSPKAVFQMTEESQAMYPQETGGILIGWKDGNTFYIEIAIGPGPKAIHKRSRFTRDGDFSQTQLDEIVVETADQWDYIGEWHSHPRKLGPSVKDLNSLRKIQMDSSYNIIDPILGLLIYEQSVWNFYCYLFQDDQGLVQIVQKAYLKK